MEPQIELLSRALFVAAVLSALPLGAVLVVGLSSSILQAVTQVQEQSLTFIPKLFAVCVVLFMSAGWIAEQLREFFEFVISSPGL